MKKKMILGSIGAVLITLLMISSTTVVATSQPNEIPDLQKNLMKRFMLKYYKIDMDKTTMGEFKQILYKLASRSNFKNQASAEQMKNDVDGFYTVLDSIGVAPGMTITDAKKIVDEHPEVSQSLGFNIICFISVDGSGYKLPVYRPLKVLAGFWTINNGYQGQATVAGLFGVQSCQGTGFSGTTLGFIGKWGDLITYEPNVNKFTIVGVALYSHMFECW